MANKGKPFYDCAICGNKFEELPDDLGKIVCDTCYNSVPLYISEAQMYRWLLLRKKKYA